MEEVKRYFEEVKLPPKEFLEKVFGEKYVSDWAYIQVGYRVYKQDGGKLSFEEFTTDLNYNPPIEDIDWIEGRTLNWELLEMNEGEYL